MIIAENILLFIISIHTNDNNIQSTVREESFEQKYYVKFYFPYSFYKNMLTSDYSHHNVLIFGSNETSKKKLINMLENHNLDTNIAFNYINLFSITNQDRETNMNEYYQIIRQLIDLKTISAIICCVQNYDDIKFLECYSYIFNVLYNANLLSVVLSKKIKIERFQTEISNYFKIDVLSPVYMQNAISHKKSIELKTKHRKSFVLSILQFICNLKQIDISKMSISKNLLTIHLEIRLRDFKVTKLESYINNLAKSNTTLCDVKNQLLHSMIVKYIMTRKKNYNQSIYSTQTGNALVLIGNKIWQPKVNEIISFNLPYVIVKFSVIGFSYKLLELSGKNIKLQVIAINPNCGCYCTCSVFTDKTRFYEEMNKVAIEKLHDLDNKIMKANTNILSIYKNFVNNDRDFRLIQEFFTELNSYCNTMFFNVSNFLEYMTEPNHDYNVEHYSGRLDCSNTNLHIDKEKMKIIHDKIKNRDVIFLVIDNCNINNRTFLRLLSMIVKSNTLYLSVCKNTNITDECLILAMKMILQSGLSNVEIKDTGITESGQKIFVSFMHTWKEYNTCGKENKLKDVMLRTIAKNLRMNDEEIDKIIEIHRVKINRFEEEMSKTVV